MDFVVVGLGLGALAILAGVIQRGWTSVSARRVSALSAPGEADVHGHTAAAANRGAGQVWLSAGSAILLATIGALAGSLDDRTGAFFVVTTVTVAALGILIWGYLHGWYAPRRRLPPAANTFLSASAAAASHPAAPAAPSPSLDDDLAADDPPEAVEFLPVAIPDAELAAERGAEIAPPSDSLDASVDADGPDAGAPRREDADAVLAGRGSQPARDDAS